MNSDYLKLVILAEHTDLTHSATTVASLCRRTRSDVWVRVLVGKGELPAGFQAGNLTVEFIRPMGSPTTVLNVRSHASMVDWAGILAAAPGWDQWWMLEAGQLVLGDLNALGKQDIGTAGIVATDGCKVGTPANAAYAMERAGAAPKVEYAHWEGDSSSHSTVIEIELATNRIPVSLWIGRSGGALMLNFAVIRRGAKHGDRASPLVTIDGVRNSSVTEASTRDWWVLDDESGLAEQGDLEWGRTLPFVVTWVGESKPWSNSVVPGSQLWLRELADWEELKYELEFRARDRGKIPTWVIHLPRVGVRSASLLDDLEDAGFGIELLRGCDAEYPVEFRASVGLLLEWFGWRPDRDHMARALSHRWAWQAFLQQSEQPYALICEDDVAWDGSEPKLRLLCSTLGTGPWALDLVRSSTVSARSECGVLEIFEASGLSGRGYCLSREAARILIDLDCCNARALFDPNNPLVGLRRWVELAGMIIPPLVSSASAGESPASANPIFGTSPVFHSHHPPPLRLLIGICSCQPFGEKRQAVRHTWFPRDLPTVSASFFVGAGEIAAVEADTVTLQVPDDYEHLPLKVLEFFRHALNHYDFEWLFKCDDDTYVVPERLLKLTGNSADYVGNEFILDRGAADGGAGYLLRRSIIEKIVADTTLAPTGNEDIIIGEAAIRHGAVAMADRRLVWDTSRLPRWDNQVITAHRLSPAKMAVVGALNSLPWSLVHLVRPDWSDHVLLHDGGYFVRKSTNDGGRWNWESSTRRLCLDWWDGFRECLVIGKENRVIADIEYSQYEHVFTGTSQSTNDHPK